MPDRKGLTATQVRLLNTIADCYYAMRIFGLSEEAAARVAMQEPVAAIERRAGQLREQRRGEPCDELSGE